jgi:HK97 family phage major capsid protein
MDMTLQPGVRAEVREDATAYMALMGEVGWDIDPKEVASALHKAKGKPVTVDIFSYGGDAMAGLAIYQMLAAHDAEVTTNVLGIAASAASVIAMGGSKRRCPANACMMVHPAWSLTMGNADDHRKSAEVLDGITDAYLNTYAKASGRPADEIRPYVMEETWLYGEDAFAVGLITEVVDPIQAMASAIPVPQDRFKRLPKAMQELISCPPRPPEPEPKPKPEPVPAAAVEPVGDSKPEPVNSISTEHTAEVGSTASIPLMATDINEAAAAAVVQERERVTTISALMKQHSMPESLTSELINSGASVEAARDAVLERIAEKGTFTPGKAVDTARADVGLSTKEVQRYSFMKVAQYLADPNPRTAAAAGFELEVSNAAAAKHERSPSGVLIPWDVLKGTPRAAAETPGQVVGTFGDGGALVGTQRLDASFIDLIRNRSAILSSGVTMLTGLSGNVEIPKKLSSSTYYFVGENVDVANSKLGFGLVNMIPRTIGVRVPISRRMMIQSSPDIENLVRSDMAESVALGMDYTAIYGTGNNGQPLGILGTTGIGSVPLSTTAPSVQKAFPANLGGGSHYCGEWGNYVDLETALAANNLDAGSMRYIANSVVRGALKQTLRAAAAGADYIMTDAGTVNGYGFTVSNQMQTNDVLFGNMQDAVIGMWSGLDVTIDPYTQSASGQVILTVHQDFDVAVRRPQSFALGT